MFPRLYWPHIHQLCLVCRQHHEPVQSRLDHERDLGLQHRQRETQGFVGGFERIAQTILFSFQKFIE